MFVKRQPRWLLRASDADLQAQGRGFYTEVCAGRRGCHIYEPKLDLQYKECGKMQKRIPSSAEAPVTGYNRYRVNPLSIVRLS
jgi:hypothetical protein